MTGAVRSSPTRATETLGVEVSSPRASTSDQGSRASGSSARPLRRTFVQERTHAFLGVGELARCSHDLHRVVVSLALAERKLRIERLLAQRLALRTAAGDPVEQPEDCIVELVRRHDRVDETPVECGRGVDHVTGHRELESPLAAYVSADGNHRRMAEPAAFAAG